KNSDWLVADEPVELGVGEGDDRETKLAEEEGVFEDLGFAHFGESLFALEALAGFEADERRLAVGIELDGGDLGESNDGLAGVGVVDHHLLAGFHVAERDEGLRVLDAVPGG